MARSGKSIAGGLFLAALAAALPSPGRAASCGEELAQIRKAESELPRLEVAPPEDRQIVCITLETNVLFARRLAAHVRNCPRSPYAKNAESWSRTRESYAAQFKDRGCKPAIRGYRG